MPVTRVEVPTNRVTNNEAVVTWETTLPEEVNSEDGVRYGVGSLTNDTGTEPNSNGTKFHTRVITGLQPNTSYICKAYSQLDGSDVGCAEGDCTKSFTTKPNPEPGQVNSLKAVPDRTEVSINERVKFTITCSGSGGSIAGQAITPAILNGEPGGQPRGTFEPNAPTVGPDPGNVREVYFTAKANGKAKIQFKSGNVDDKVDIMVNP